MTPSCSTSVKSSKLTPLCHSSDALLAAALHQKRHGQRVKSRNVRCQGFCPSPRKQSRYLGALNLQGMDFAGNADYVVTISACHWCMAVYKRLLADEITNTACISQRPTVTLVRHTHSHWETEPEWDGQLDPFIIKVQTIGGYREREQPVPLWWNHSTVRCLYCTVGELCGLEGSSLCKRLLHPGNYHTRILDGPRRAVWWV